MLSKRKKTTEKIKDLMIRVILLFLFIGMLFACYKYIQRVNQLLSDEVTMNVSEVAQKSAELMQNQLENTFSTLSTLSVIVGSQNISEEELKKLFQEKCNQYGFSIMGTVDVNGKTLTSSETSVDFRERSFFLKSLQGERYISVDTSEGSSYFYISNPVLDKDEVIGVTFVKFHTDNLVNKLDAFFYDNQAQVYILNDGGEIILDTEKKNIGKNIFLLDDVVGNEEIIKQINRQLGSRKIGLETIGVGAEKRLNVYIPFQKNFAYSDLLNGWKYVVSLPKNTVYANADELMNRTFEALFVGMLGFVLFFIYFAYLRYKKKIELERLEELEIRDRLTGIGNEKYFYKKGRQVITYNPEVRYVIVYFDINNFKILNDTFGYDYGDFTLQNIANVLRANLKNDEVYAKFPNDHYVLMLDMDEKGMDGIFNKIYKMQEEILKRFKGTREITLSVGIYVLQPDDSSLHRAVNKANMARTYVKRRSEENIIVYDENFYRSMKEESILVDEMKKALKDDGFQVYYQPKYCLQTGEMVGSEALLRWNHSTRSFISPAIFVPIAERNGLIVDIGRKVLEIVCKDLAEWKQEHLEILPVSVNLSRVELYQEDVVETILFLIKCYDVSAKWLEFEITETAAIDQLSNVSSIVDELRKNSFKILLDDFGTGYSSLSCLKEIPIDILKMDRAFLENFETDVKAQNVTKAIVYLAKSLGLKTIIEGVETKQQAEMMKTFGCDYVQGYYFAKPMCKEEYVKYLYVKN